MTKVDHLTENEINEIFFRWYRGEKVSALFDELKIEKTPNLSFAKHFPPILCELACPNCFENLFAFRANSALFKKTNLRIDASTAHCLNCEHTESPQCSCERCTSNREEERRIQDQKEEEKLRERLIHLERLYDQIVPIDFKKDTLIKLIYIYTLCHQSTCEDVTLISPPSNAESPLTPSNEWSREIIQTLLNNIAPYSDNKTLLQIDQNGSASWSGQEVFYRIKIGEICETEFLEVLFHVIQSKLKEMSTEESLELISLYEKLMISECISYLEFMRSEFQLPHEVGAKTTALFKALIKDWRIDQIYTIIWGRCKDALASKVQNRLSRNYASNLVIGMMQKYVDRATQNNWEINSYYRDSRNNRNTQSSISYVLFNKLLGLGGFGVEYNFQDVLTKLGVVNLPDEQTACVISEVSNKN